MRDIRPFGWVIIAINAYILISFFAGYDVNHHYHCGSTGSKIASTRYAAAI